MALSDIEFWLHGPVAGVPSLLQPAAHALLQARGEIKEAIHDFPEALLWSRPANVASVGFHLQHMAGVLDRMCTYAKGEQLNQQQLDYLFAEEKENANIHLPYLFNNFSTAIDNTVEQLRHTSENSLLETRRVGRKQLPSTVIGLLFHAAEHIQRHTGQLLVTVRVALDKE